MKLEFSLIGDGTNIQVALLEMLGETEVIKDRFYSALHTFPFCMVPGSLQCEYENTFYDLEEVLPKPTIGGSLGHLHPYWAEREAARKRRLKAVES